MNTLTLKHLKNYLDTGLKGIATDGSTYELIGLTTEYGIFKNEKYSKVEGQIKDFKPILRPLSDLHKEIEHQGMKIIPFVELAKIIRIGYGVKIDGNYINANEYEYPDEPEYHTEEHLWLYGAKWETGIPNSVAPNCQETLIIYPPKLTLGIKRDGVSNIHFQHRQFVHGGSHTHPVRNLTKVIEKLQEMHFDYMGLILSGLAIDINTL